MSCCSAAVMSSRTPAELIWQEHSKPRHPERLEQRSGSARAQRSAWLVIGLMAVWWSSLGITYCWRWLFMSRSRHSHSIW